MAEMVPTATLAEALDLARERVGPTVLAYAIPHALLTPPVMG